MIPGQCSQDRAIKLATDIEEQSTAVGLTWLSLGKSLDAAREEHAAIVLGLTWDQFIEKYCKCSRSWANECLYSYRATKDLPESTVLSIGPSKAAQLAQPAVRALPESEREKLTELAMTYLSAAEFKKEIRRAVGEPKFHEQEWVSIKIPIQLRERIEAALNKMARAFRVEDKALCWQYLVLFIERIPEGTLKSGASQQKQISARN